MNFKIKDNDKLSNSNTKDQTENTKVILILLTKMQKKIKLEITKENEKSKRQGNQKKAVSRSGNSQMTNYE